MRAATVAERTSGVRLQADHRRCPPSLAPPAEQPPPPIDRGRPGDKEIGTSLGPIGALEARLQRHLFPVCEAATTEAHRLPAASPGGLHPKGRPQMGEIARWAKQTKGAKES